MPLALRYLYLAIIQDSIYQAVLFVDFTAPVAGKIVLKRFWASYACIAVANDIPYELIDFL